MDHIYTHGKASVSDVLKEVKPRPSSRRGAPLAGLAAMITVAVALALPLGERIQAHAAATAAATRPATQAASTQPGTQPGENLPQAEVATVMEMAGRAEIVALGIVEKKRDGTAKDAGIAYDVRLEKVLKGKWDKPALSFRSVGWVGYATYDKDERVLLFLKRFNDEFIQLKPVIYLGDGNRPGSLTLQPAEEYIKVVANIPIGQGFPWGDGLPGSDLSLEKAIKEAIGSGFAYAAVCRAASGFGDDDVSLDGIRQKEGKLSAIQAYEVQEVLWGNMKRGRTGIVYGVTHTPTVRERPVCKDETVLWLCGRRGGIKVLANTPPNRQAVKKAFAEAATAPAPSGAATQPGAAVQTARAAGAATPAHGEEIVIPLDFRREVVLLPRPAALAAMHWDAARLDQCCRQELAAQRKKGADPNRVAFGADYTNRAAPVPLSDLAEVRVRPITFVAQEELKDLAARLAGNDRRAAEASLPELDRLGGRARNIVPMLLPHIKVGKSYSEVLTVVHGLGMLGPHAAEAVPTLAEKFRTAEVLDKSWYALALGHVGAPAVATLERLLRQESDEIGRRAAAHGLARGDAAGRMALCAALGDPSADVRAAAVAELPDDSDRETRDLVVRLLADPAAGVRQAAAGKASLCEPALKGQAVAALLGMLSEADERSQICALYGLGALHSRPEIVVPRLKPFLKTRGEASGQTRGAALSAVERFGPAAADLAPEVIACLDGDETQTVAALRALEAIGGKPAGAAAARVVVLAASKNWGIADAAASTLFTVETDASAHAARVVSLLSDQNVDTRQRLVTQALAAMGPAAKGALPALASRLVSAGSVGFVPTEKVRWMAAIDAEGAVAAIENDQRAQPRRGDGFRVQDQRAGSLIILRRLKAHAAAVAEQARQEGLRRPTREFDYRPSRDWPRVVRAGDRIERVIALLGTPDSVGDGLLTYDALPGKDSSCRPRKIVVSVEHGKATAVREEAPVAAKVAPAGEEGFPGSNAQELFSGATTQPASQPTGTATAPAPSTSSG